MSIGEIITTPQGLGVVVEVLPTSFKVGSYTLGQVVAEPLTGGPETVPSGAPAPGAEPLTLYQAIQAQAAALYVASVVETQLIPFARELRGTRGSQLGQPRCAPYLGGTSLSNDPGNGRAYPPANRRQGLAPFRR